jgi:hypothetical protein
VLPPVGVVPTPPATVSELKLTVEIAGSAATPDGAGKYTVAPGQLVVVKASDSSAWLGSAQATGVTRTDVDTSATQWTSRFANPGATDGSYKLVASASGDRSKELNFVVQTGDYRNGDYMVFAANGSRQTFSVDFDKATYSMTDAAGDKTSGTLTKPAVAGQAWGVLNSRIIGPNTSSAARPGRYRRGRLPVRFAALQPGDVHGRTLRGNTRARHEAGQAGRRLQPFAHRGHRHDARVGHRPDRNLRRRHRDEAVRRPGDLSHRQMPASERGDQRGCGRWRYRTVDAQESRRAAACSGASPLPRSTARTST